jgi:hypothetical protein
MCVLVAVQIEQSKRHQQSEGAKRVAFFAVAQGLYLAYCRRQCREIDWSTSSARAQLESFVVLSFCRGGWCGGCGWRPSRVGVQIETERDIVGLTRLQACPGRSA